MHTPHAGTTCIMTVTCGVVTARRYQQQLAARCAAASFCGVAKASPLCSGKLREHDASTEADARAVVVRALHRGCQMFSIAARTSPDAGRGDKDGASQSRASQQLGRRHASITLRVCIVSCSQANRFPMP